MASKNQVTLTFAGDSDQLEKAFDRVGSAADEMGTEVGKASKKVGHETASGFDRAGEAADDLDTKAMGFRDTMTGVQDTMGGAAMIAKGDLFQGFFTLGMGIGDLGSGIYNFLIPAFKKLITTKLSDIVQTGRQVVAWTASKTAMVASAVATKALAIAQRGLNLAMRANPIGLIITGLLLLAAGLIYAYKHSATFRRIVQGAMRGVRIAFGWVIDKGKDLVGWFKSMPGWIGSAIGGLANIILFPYKQAFNAIKWLWNSTVGGFGFSVPSWIPHFGGKSFAIPRMHTGGVVPGAPGQEQLAILQAGERVTPASQSGRTVLEIRSGGSAMDDLLVEMLRKAVRVRGGDVQVVLGT